MDTGTNRPVGLPENSEVNIYMSLHIYVHKLDSVALQNNRKRKDCLIYSIGTTKLVYVEK